MAHRIDMPKLSDTMEEGGVSQWFKKEGDKVAEGDLLLAIETDKATMEYPSPEAGILLKILVQPGKAVPLQTPIAIIGAKGENIDALLKADAPSVTNAAPVNKKTEAKIEATPQPIAPSTPAGKTKASPLAKKIAKDQNIDLTNVSGSGPGGRIISRDLKDASSAKSSMVTRKPQQGDQKIPHTMMRKTIAKRLLAGKNDAPHFYLTTSADMTNVLAWREQLNADPDIVAKKAAKVSVNDIICLCVARALQHHPMLNASWQEDGILVHGSIHLAVAVALESGLMTPVVSDADQLGLKELGASIRSLVDLAKNQKLKPEQYQGGTFTISNLGMTVVDEFTAIINPPQAAILAVGRTKAVVQVGDNGQFFAQQRMSMTLSCDHRVVDGMVGAQYLKTLVSYLENPLQMLS